MREDSIAIVKTNVKNLGIKSCKWGVRDLGGKTALRLH